MLTENEKILYRKLRELAVNNRVAMNGLVQWCCEMWNWRHAEFTRALDNLAEDHRIKLEGVAPYSIYDALTILELPGPTSRYE